MKKIRFIENPLSEQERAEAEARYKEFKKLERLLDLYNHMVKNSKKHIAHIESGERYKKMRKETSLNEKEIQESIENQYKTIKNDLARLEKTRQKIIERYEVIEKENNEAFNKLHEKNLETMRELHKKGLL